MATHDLGHKLTDKELAALEKRIASVYKDARDGLNDTISEYFAKFVERDKHQQELLKAGKITEEQYKLWRLNQIGRGKRFEALRDEVAKRYTEANETAIAYVNDETPGIYSLNRNYAAYTIEKEAGNVGFNLWDEQTVKRLIVEEPNLMPYYPPQKAVKRGIDLAWGKRQITASVTSNILQGYSIGKIADDLQDRIETMNRSSALRAARTAVTGAQNAGRYDSYRAAKEMGIDLEAEWLATLDNRTRHSHAMLDGERREIDIPFEVDGKEILFPGHNLAVGELIYNCRCTIIAVVKGVDTSDAKRRAIDPETGESVLIEDMTYQEWAGWKKETRQVASESKSAIIKYNKVQQRRDLLTQKETIEKAKVFADRINANIALLDNGYSGYSAIRCFINSELGYDGLPKVLNAEEFEAYAHGKTILYRGVRSSSDKSAKEIAEEFKHGKLWANNNGQAIYGRGVYFAKDESIAQVNYAGVDGEMILSVLSDDARIADYATLYKEFMETGIPQIIGDAKEDYQDIIRDIGFYASIKGYDAIATNGFLGHDYVVLLNRKKVVVRE